MSWWYPTKHKTGMHYAVGKVVNFTLPDDSRKPVETEVKPPGDWWGPFHCERCAISCGSFGKTEEGAYRSNHGTDDERFCENLGWF